MGEVSPAARTLARQVLALEAGGQLRAEELARAVERACRRLRLHLADVIGPVGFDSLLTRALRLAQGEVPALERIALAEDLEPSLQGAHEFAATHGPVAAGDAFAAILAHFIWLLITFIGEDLGLHLIRETWPEIARRGGFTEPRARG